MTRRVVTRRGEVRNVDWSKLFRDCEAVGQTLSDAKGMLEHLAVVTAILEASKAWPEVAQEWNALVAAVKEVAGDVRA